MTSYSSFLVFTIALIFTVLLSANASPVQEYNVMSIGANTLTEVDRDSMNVAPVVEDKELAIDTASNLNTVDRISINGVTKRLVKVCKATCNIRHLISKKKRKKCKRKCNTLYCKFCRSKYSLCRRKCAIIHLVSVFKRKKCLGKCRKSYGVCKAAFKC